MPKVNPVVLIQLIQKYSESGKKDSPRVFTFMKNNRMRVHHETLAEMDRRKSWLSDGTKSNVREKLVDILECNLRGKLGDKKVWIDDPMFGIALPLELSSSEMGYGVLPTGSRIPIPAGKIVRAFTYWENVNDIDLSCFAIDGSGYQKEFSWRTMFGQQSKFITFSGDVTDGYEGGSEYFDVDIEMFKKNYPSFDFKYLVFCNNIFSNGGKTHFKDVICKAGFMMRDELRSGMVYEPATVNTSFRMTADSSFGYLFAIDLERREMVWLNLAQNGNHAIAGNHSIDDIGKYLGIANVINIGWLYKTAGKRVLNPDEADILVTDRYSPGTKIDGKEIVRSCDFEKVLTLLSA